MSSRPDGNSTFGGCSSPRVGIERQPGGTPPVRGLAAVIRALRLAPRTAACGAGLIALLAAAACGGEPPESDGRVAQNPLLRPRDFQATAPPAYRVRLETTEGTVVIAVRRQWAPRAADRFYNLVRAGWYDGVRFHRVLEGFVAEWGIHGDPWVNAAWRQAEMRDDTVRASNTRGRVSFSQHGPGTRTTQVFINLGDNVSLDERGFAPFGEVVEGMEVVEALHAGYGDGPPRGEDGVYQAMAIARGDAYLDEFPDLDRIEGATLVEP